MRGMQYGFFPDDVIRLKLFDSLKLDASFDDADISRYQDDQKTLITIFRNLIEAHCNQQLQKEKIYLWLIDLIYSEDESPSREKYNKLLGKECHAIIFNLLKKSCIDDLSDAIQSNEAVKLDFWNELLKYLPETFVKQFNEVVFSCKDIGLKNLGGDTSDEFLACGKHVQEFVFDRQFYDANQIIYLLKTFYPDNRWCEWLMVGLQEHSYLEEFIEHVVLQGEINVLSAMLRGGFDGESFDSLVLRLIEKNPHLISGDEFQLLVNTDTESQQVINDGKEVRKRLDSAADLLRQQNAGVSNQGPVYEEAGDLGRITTFARYQDWGEVSKLLNSMDVSKNGIDVQNIIEVLKKYGYQSSNCYERINQILERLAISKDYYVVQRSFRRARVSIKSTQDSVGGNFIQRLVQITVMYNQPKPVIKFQLIMCL